MNWLPKILLSSSNCFIKQFSTKGKEKKKATKWHVGSDRGSQEFLGRKGQGMFGLDRAVKLYFRPVAAAHTSELAVTVGSRMK